MLVIVSGLSGSGKSNALRILEDMGYYCVDNIPVKLFPTIAAELNHDYTHAAVSLDVRNLPESPDKLTELLNSIVHSDHTILLFFTADNAVLIRRYNDTRRRHPLSKKKLSLEEGIIQEKHALSPIQAVADLVIDTSTLSVHDLAAYLRKHLPPAENTDLTITFHSFGFKFGIPSNVDYVFDVRFLPNPHWKIELRPLTGRDDAVIDYLEEQPLVNQFVEDTAHYIEKWLPHLEQNNRSYLNIAIGCTGGQHRSVYIAEKLADYFAKKEKNIAIRHHTLEQKNHK